LKEAFNYDLPSIFFATVCEVLLQINKFIIAILVLKSYLEVHSLASVEAQCSRYINTTDYHYSPPG